LRRLVLAYVNLMALPVQLEIKLLVSGGLNGGRNVLRQSSPMGGEGQIKDDGQGQNLLGHGSVLPSDHHGLSGKALALRQGIRIGTAPAQLNPTHGELLPAKVRATKRTRSW